MKNMHSTPEWQAQMDWRDEGVFLPSQLEGNAAQRYCQEARRIEREWRATQYGGQPHVV
ncbi:hypothetical protein [Halomonas sp. HL-93]|uniref:hypothetical protein n=1 Tax=Halomonas sp. HL-93 TaxID=1666906 RepID=UPI0006DBD316|nr:hypothetical protein [Halomonas sp. HL-93]KPQ19666.1 MAG: hypothetical protein HLUCCO06_01345 [Halomonas sp. HL-93]SBR52003.1 hypothetical protein GA0071314_3473 [Halomonas sp. HL-93]